jgi:uroporphyrinogen-III synthase
VSKRVAITRAQPEAESTAARVRARGHMAIVAPLLTIVPCGYDTSLHGVQALLFTSSNGVRAFPNHRGAQAVTVLAVGDSTAQAARDSGFANVHSAQGDVGSLAALAKRMLSPASGKLLHIGGADIAGDLAGDLTSAGFLVERRVAYAATAASALPSAYAEPLDIVLFHSARAAAAFIALGAPHADRLIAACMSPNVAETAAQTSWAQLVVAPRPREDDLLDATFPA